ncbi:MAG: DUF2169 domain-containing protein [Myxococcales bacterium]|nr:DUF2169 domain-containing protein [Myxococcales bacterium]
MEPTGEWPLAIIATQDVACGARLWSVGGRRRATIFVKATFSLARGGPMQLVAPAPLLLGDQHHEGNLERSVLACADVAPYLPRAEVLLTGHACATSPSPSLPVRLAVVGSRPLVDKTLHVFGERMWLEGEQMTAPVPFTRIPLRYERAYRGPAGFEENPVGMPIGPGLPVANIIDPADPFGPAGFGPIAALWPARRRLLRDLDPSVVEAPAPQIPDPFAWSFFHAAPPDQRCSFFEGNEWVVLEGMHPELARIESQLPGARAQARVYGVEATGHREVGLSADTLWIDADRLIACLCWRGNFEVESDAALASAQVFAGLEMPGRPIPWPGTTARQASAAPAAIEPAPAAPPQAAPEPQPAPQPQPQPTPLPQPAPAAQPPIEATAPAPAEPLGPVSKAPDTLPGRWSPGSTLASPGVVPSQLRQLEAAVRPPESITNPRIELPAPPAPAGEETLAHIAGSTLKQPPSELRRLIAKVAAEETTPPPNAPLVSFDDSPTYTPDSADVRKIVEEAEQAAEAAALREARPEPVGVRPSPGPGMRSSKTTIRGLGEADGKSASEPPPPTARVEATEQARAIMQADEQPTAQLPIPDLLLKLASETTASSQPAPQGVQVPESPPQIVHVDDDDMGRPTLRGEAPAFAQVAAKAPPVHEGETRLEVERRIREGESLAGLDLSDLDLSGFDLSGQRLAACRFDRTKLHGSRMRGADLSGASFEGADATEADFDDAILERTNFVGAKLAGAKLRRTFLTDANLTTADLTGAVIDQSSGLRTIFCRARLDRASMQGATLDGADFTEAQLDEASLDGALLPELRAYEISAEGARFCRASLRGARFDGAVLGRARFDHAHADDSIWDRAVLDGASLEGARLVGASFTKASLRSATLTGADLSEARFNRASLVGAKLVGIDLTAVTLDGADLSGVVTDV